MDISTIGTSREIKSRRVDLLMKPTTHAMLVSEAKKHGISVNECVSRIIKGYFMEQAGSKTPKYKGSI